MIGLTPKQAECLDFLKAYIAQHGKPPIFREIADGIGLKSKSDIFRLVAALKERGAIDFLPRRSRSISIIEPLKFLPADVRNFVTEYAKAHHVLPETVIAERMREWAEHEKRGAA